MVAAKKQNGYVQISPAGRQKLNDIRNGYVQISPAGIAALNAIKNGQPTPAAAPAAPARVDPFLTADDLQAINQFNTDLATKLQGIDTGLANAETDTKFQTTQTDNAAKQSSSAAQDDAISRGIFQSSIKDATLYDIEAQRSLSDKFLQDKLTTARLDAGTNKQILGTAKTNFDAAMIQRQADNAQGVNDANSAGWAQAMAAWAAANPTAATPTGPAPPIPSFTPPKTKPQVIPNDATAFGRPMFPSAPTSRPNVATGSGSTKPGAKRPKVKYGN